MEISTAAPPSFVSLNANATKSPDSDLPADALPAKSHPYTNGVLKKRHAPPHIHAPAPSYKECLKNHAAAMGRHALDGCGEFMPSPASLPSDPTSLKCAACGCHRNFHRLDHHHPQPLAAARHVIEYHPQHRHHPPPPPPPNPQSPPPISSSYYPPSGGPHMLIALGGGSHPIQGLNSPRKRFRTKFTQFQKEKMRELAEKLGWKMQKSGEDLVAEFCREVGVERGVFKVWMHNNKNTFQKQLQQPPILVQSSTPTTTTTNVDDNGSSGNNDAVNGAADGSSNSS